uniref:Sushi domain-containing protein n=1 Tax=Plectus sambesii TaxID=2011161 RepID=A0A914UY05_9BILA
MFSWRTTTFVGLYCLFMMVGNGGGCHSTFPEGDQTEIVEPVTCAVSSDPFGTFGPAPGSIVGHGTVVGLTCDPSYHASIIPAVQTCNNGVLGPPLQCLPNTCPDIAFLLLPGDTMAPLQFKTFDPVATMPTYPIVFDTSLVLTCTGFGVVLVDSGPFQYCQNAQNFAMLGELVTLTYVLDQLSPPKQDYQ